MGNEIKLGEINMDDDSSIINDSLEDLYGEDSLEVSENNRIPENLPNITDSEDYDVSENNKNISNQESNQEPDEEPDEESDEDIVESNIDSNTFQEDLNKYNDLALLAMSIKEQEPNLFDFEISPEMSAEDFVSNIKNNLASYQEAVTQAVQNQYGEAARYLNMILQGDGDGVGPILDIHKIGAIELTGYEQDDYLESIVSEYLLRKGTPKEDIKDLLEVYKERGSLLEKADESIKFHRELEQEYLETWEAQKEEQRRKYEEMENQYLSMVKGYINGGQVKGLPIKDKRGFEQALFEPTHLIETLDNSGRKITKKVPLLSVKVAQFQNDLEQQLAFQLLLLNDFDFTELAKQQERKINNNLLDILNERSGKPSNNRSRGSGYFDE